MSPPLGYDEYASGRIVQLVSLLDDGDVFRPSIKHRVAHEVLSRELLGLFCGVACGIEVEEALRIAANYVAAHVDYAKPPDLLVDVSQLLFLGHVVIVCYILQGKLSAILVAQRGLEFTYAQLVLGYLVWLDCELEIIKLLPIVVVKILDILFIMHSTNRDLWEGEARLRMFVVCSCQIRLALHLKTG